MTSSATGVSTKSDTNSNVNINVNVNVNVNELDLQAVIRFVTVTELGSFAEAARVLGVSRQAVHRSIDSLEQASGGPLLDRDGQGLRLTILGRKLLPQARVLRDVSRQIRATIDAASNQPSGLIRLTAPGLFGESVMAPAIAKFLRTWPAVRIEARFDTARTDLLRDDFDLMIRICSRPDPGHFAILLGRAEVILSAAPDYLAQYGSPKSPEDLANHSLLEYGRLGSTQWTLIPKDHNEENEEDARTIPVIPRFTGDSAAVVVQACQQGLGILRAPKMAVSRLIERGELVPVLPDWHFRQSEIWAIYGHRSDTDPTLAALLEALREVKW